MYQYHRSRSQDESVLDSRRRSSSSPETHPRFPLAPPPPSTQAPPNSTQPHTPVSNDSDDNDITALALRHKRRPPSTSPLGPPPPSDLPPPLTRTPPLPPSRIHSSPGVPPPEPAPSPPQTNHVRTGLLQRSSTVSSYSKAGNSPTSTSRATPVAVPPVPQRRSSRIAPLPPVPMPIPKSPTKGITNDGGRSLFALVTPRSPPTAQLMEMQSPSNLFVSELPEAPIPPPDSADKREERRGRIAAELLETERSYLASLKELQQEWLPAIRHALKKEKASLDELNSNLFNSIDLITQFNSTLMSELASVIEHWTPDKKAPFLKMYSQYAGYYVEATELFERLKKKVPSLGSVLSDLAKKTGALSLDQYLIMPIQRIPRYELLLRDLLKNTPEQHPDHASLRMALDTVKHVADRVNSFNANETKNNERVIELELQNALAPHRQYLCDDVFQLIDASAEKRPIRLILFSDILIRDESVVKGVSKTATNPKISKLPTHPDWCWPLKLLWVIETSDSNNNIANGNKSSSTKEKEANGDNSEEILELRGPDNRMRLVTTAAVKQRWLSLLRTYITRSLDFGEDFHGRRNGEFTFHRVGTYRGWWSQGYRHGQGTHIVNGAKYEGEWRFGRQQGTGTMTYANGAVYVGEWHKGLRHGRGRFSDPAGTVYEGEWKANRKHGKGTLTYINGSTFVGEWENDEINGQGTLKAPHGLEYVGGWKNSKFSGTGRLKMVNGKIYEGKWKAGLRDGEGRLTYPNGAVYEGQWKQNKKHGHGTYRSSPMEGPFAYTGEWQKGHRHGEGTLTLSDGSSYTGTFHNGKPNGRGTFTYGSTHVYLKYEGEWAQGRRHGKGELHYRSGCIFRGTFRDDSHSQGRLIFPNGVIYEGSWTGETFEGHKVSIYPSEDALENKKARRSENKEAKTIEHVIMKSTQLTHYLSGVVNPELLLEMGENSAYGTHDMYPIADLLPVLDFVAPTGQQW